MPEAQPIPQRYDEAARRLARTAYETLEPLHVVAYFNPVIREQQKSSGLSRMARYLAGRGAPLGDCPGAVVAATFYNFNPTAVGPAWDEAVAYGLDRTYAMHLEAVEGTLRTALGPLTQDPELARVATRFAQIAQGLSYAGRPLAAAWASTETPDAADAPHLRLWHAFAALREYRGDGHLAALVQAGLSGAEALVFHEAPHPDPTLRRRALGADFARASRAWSDEEWGAATQALQQRGLLDDQGTISPAGVVLYDALEVATDDAAAGIFDGVDDATELIAAGRPFVKAVLDAGILPGTVAKGA
ncbi:hypothetical protein [Allobranchiibius sp. GilTou73]|uniref:SCO6745 family protein n=1 Tax=Allobranchiibius sp. GilTou73 TaxID=2904523 RepID=UPI001F43CD4E|nr:hypothetical protein [Allobranchiibius sp. GilTou73]UIJ36199.1 hypothetical protein LVQ62_07480 [Allobranchiibius sp. GilTou73]